MEPNAIKAFRKARGQSQSAFGAELAVDRKTVQRWEHGETRPPGRLLELACERLEDMGTEATGREMIATGWANDLIEEMD